MTRRELERRLRALGLRLERNAQFVERPNGESFTARWQIRPDTVGSCMAREIVPLRRLAEAEAVLDMREISQGDR